MKNGPLIVGLGEALFDLLPTGATLGGAPLNLAVHACQLVNKIGGHAAVVSRIGSDLLGDRVFRELESRGLDTTFLQRDADKPTGTVKVSLDQGEPSYEIVRDVAWDRLEWSREMESLAGQCEAVCFGTLGQRSSQSRETVQRFLTNASRAIRLFDVNLRQDFFDTEIVLESCRLASVVKMNSGEFPVVGELLGHSEGFHHGPLFRDGAEQLMREFQLNLVVLTRGAEGTVLHTPNRIVEGSPAYFEPKPGADTVGAGDACSAAVLHGLLQKWPLEKTVALANLAGAWVATRKGATPVLPLDLTGDQK